MFDSLGTAVLVYGIVCLVFLIGFGIWSTARDYLDRRNAPAGIPAVRPPMPRRYPGCITCEAAELHGSSAMVRHQEREHTGGVQW